jgi:hypothetical protein
MVLDSLFEGATAGADDDESGWPNYLIFSIKLRNT